MVQGLEMGHQKRKSIAGCDDRTAARLAGFGHKSLAEFEGGGNGAGLALAYALVAAEDFQRGGEEAGKLAVVVLEQTG